MAAAIAAIEKIIETAASTPEAQNELKKNQLRMLATLNGTLRDDEGQACQNCTDPPFPLYPPQKITWHQIANALYDRRRNWPP